MKKTYLFISALVVTGILVCGGVGIAKAAMSGTPESRGTIIAEPTPIVMDANAETGRGADKASAAESLELEDSNAELNYYLHTGETM